MLRYLTNKIKNIRREKNHDAVKGIYRRGAALLPAESLVVNQQASPQVKDKILAAAQARRDQRNARRLNRVVKKEE